jgi:hypothetical protein
MTRFKLFVGFVLITIVFVLGSTLVLSGVLNDVEDNNRKSVKKTRQAAGAAISLAQTKLSKTHGDLQRGALPSYLRTLQEWRFRLDKLQEELDGKFPDRNGQIDERKKVVIRKRALLTGFVESLVSNINKEPGASFWKNESRSQFKTRIRKGLIECASQSNNFCMFYFTHDVLKKHWSAMKKLRSTPFSRPQLGIVVDDQGTGRANTTDQTWSNKVNFQRDNEDLQKAVRPENKGMGVAGVFTSSGRTTRVYLSHSAPLTHRGEFVGSAIIGIELDKDFADQVSSITRQTTILFNEKGLIGGGWNDQDENIRIDARHALQQSSVSCSNDSNFACLVIPLRFLQRQPQIFLTVAVNDNDSNRVISSARSTLLFTLTLMFFVSMVFGAALIRDTEQDFIVIDQGVHEIIAGDRDFEFPFDLEKQTMANSMAQSMNTMMALLLGRDLPEDDGALEEWTGSFFSETGASTKNGQKRNANDLAKEPADSYYKRLYQEYREARILMGQEVASLNYVKFVEKVARAERRQREMKSVRMVRFNVKVHQQTKRVYLDPVQID